MGFSTGSFVPETTLSLVLRYKIGSWFITKLPRSPAVTCLVLSDGGQDKAEWKLRVGCLPRRRRNAQGTPDSRRGGTEHSTMLMTEVGLSLSPWRSSLLPVDLMWGGRKVAIFS